MTTVGFPFAYAISVISSGQNSMSQTPSVDSLSQTELQAALDLIEVAIREDLHGAEDVTTGRFIPESAQGKIAIVSRRPGVLCGGVLIAPVLDRLGGAKISNAISDASPLQPGTVIAELTGSMRTLLTAERTILNFLTLLSGVSTLTHQYVEAVAGTSAKILDTRKTLPGLRALQKYAVRCGGGHNHRMGLFDAVLVKDNHLAWFQKQHSGSLADAAQHIRGQIPAGMIVEFEVDSLSQLEELLPGRPDIVLLDNMTIDQLQQAVTMRDGTASKVLLEASGGVNLMTVGEIARTGVDRISVGALTHSAPALDLGFDWAE